MNIRDRLMSRASVAVMAAFAPDGLPPGAERVEDAGGGGGDADLGDMDGLSPEEQAQFDAMRSGSDAGSDDRAGDAGEATDAGDADGDGDADGEPDGDSPPGDSARDGAGDRREPAAADGDKRVPKTINYGRHQKMLAAAEKEKADLQARLEAAEKSRNEEKEQRARLDERTKLLLEAINTRQPPAPAPAAAPAKDEDPEPDAEVDPLAHIQWENRQLRKDLQEIKSGRQKEQELSAAEQEERQVYGNFEASLVAESQVDPEFADAFAYLRDTRYTELGYIYANIDINDPQQCATLPPAQRKALSDHIQQAFYNEQVMTARAATQAGRNPAHVVKNLAKARGFKPKPAEPVPQDPPADPPARANGKGNGAAPPAARAPAPSVSEQLDQIRANQRDAKSLSDAGGAPGGDITVERLATMSDDEFAQFYETMPKAKLDRIMGKVPQ